MPTTVSSFFTRLRQKFFYWRVNLEIHDRIFPHLEREQDHGYSFSTDEEMEVQIEALNAQVILDQIEEHISKMPKAYSKAFRYILHRELHAVLKKYEPLARRAVQPTHCDPRFVATRAV